MLSIKKCVPECEKCIYYLKQNRLHQDTSLCLKYGKQKFFEFETALSMRNDNNKCGELGKHFIEIVNYRLSWFNK